VVEHENKLNQPEQEKVQLRNEMVQKTNPIVFQLDRQDQYIRRENILIYGIEQGWRNCGSRAACAGPALAGAGPNARPRRAGPLWAVIVWRRRVQSTVLRSW